MAFNFPTSPSPGQTYLGPNNIEYTWDGVTWMGTSEAGGAIDAGSANQVLYKNASNALTGSDELVFNSSDSMGLGATPGGYGENSKLTIDGTGKSNGIFINFNGTGADKQIVLNNAAGSVGFIGTNNTTLTIGTGTAERLHITGAGNIGIGGTPTETKRSVNETSPAYPKLQIFGGALGQNKGNILSNLKISSSSVNSDELHFLKVRTADGNNWTTASHRIQSKVDNTWQSFIEFNGDGNNGGISFGAGETQPNYSQLGPTYVPIKMKIDTGGNIILDSKGDIIWRDENGVERHRLFDSSGGFSNFWYQKDAGANNQYGPILYTGNFVTTYVHFQSTSLFTNPGFTNILGGWDNSQNFIDAYPPAGYTMSNLQSFIPSIGSIHFAGVVNADDAIRCNVALLADRIRVWVQNTEQREAPRVNLLAIWRR